MPKVEFNLGLNRTIVPSEGTRSAFLNKIFGMGNKGKTASFLLRMMASAGGLKLTNTIQPNHRRLRPDIKLGPSSISEQSR